MNTQDTLRLPQLFQYRAEQAHRRAVAFCQAPEYVLGTRVRPLTPATFSMLFAVRNGFLFGKSPDEHDVRQFVWFHSPLYCNAAGWFPRLRKRVALARLNFALNQRWRRWLALGWSVEQHLAMLALAASEIREIITDAFADQPSQPAKPGRSLACLEAFFVHEFATGYGWTPERTRDTPIRQLIQLHRLLRLSRGEDVSDQGEDQILVEHLRKKNEAGAAAREAKATHAK